MKKADLLNFINRYYLAGATTSVKWTAQDGNVETKFISDDQNVIGSVVSSLDLGNNELGVYATPQLTKMLSALGDDINVKVNSIDTKSVSIDIDDTDVDMKFMLADLSVIRQVPNLKSLPDFDVKIELNKDFSNNFKKAANALPESDNFGVESDGTDTKIIINHSSVNTNRIVFKTETKETVAMDTICFSAKLFKEILNANADATGMLEVSSKGLARVTFSNADYTATYYLVKLTIA